MTPNRQKFIASITNPDAYYDELMEQIWEKTFDQMWKEIKAKLPDWTDLHLCTVLNKYYRRLCGVEKYKAYQGINCNSDPYIAFAETFMQIWEKANQLTQEEMMKLAFKAMHYSQLIEMKKTGYQGTIESISKDGKLKIRSHGTITSGISLTDINWNK